MADNRNFVSLGALCMDLISYGARFPNPGETLVGSKFEMGYGGKAGNACVAAVRLGASASMIGQVGDDQFGKDYVNYFKENKINTDQVLVANEASTTTANIYVTDEGENCIMFTLGATGTITLNQINGAEEVIKNATLFSCSFESPMETMIRALEIARKHSVMTVVNAAPYRGDINPECYMLFDIFCVNETEAELLAKIPVKTVDDAKKAAKIFLSRGCSNVIITLGSMGALHGSSQQEECVHVPTSHVKVVDTTGAGDAFMGALIYYLLMHSSLPMEEKIRRSCEIASISIQKPGTQKSYPWRDDVPSALLQQ